MLMPRKPVTALARRLERARHPHIRSAIWARARRAVEGELRAEMLKAEHAAYREQRRARASRNGAVDGPRFAEVDVPL